METNKACHARTKTSEESLYLYVGDHFDKPFKKKMSHISFYNFKTYQSNAIERNEVNQLTNADIVNIKNFTGQNNKFKVLNAE